MTTNMGWGYFDNLVLRCKEKNKNSKRNIKCNDMLEDGK